MLDKKSYKILKWLYRKKCCTYAEISKITGVDESGSGRSPYISSLYMQHFIGSWSVEEPAEINGFPDSKDIGYTITIQGEAYIEQRRRDTRNFWIPYSITTFIALLSLVGTIADNWSVIHGWIASIFGN